MPSREQMISELVGVGEDAAALNAMEDNDLVELYKQRVGMNMSEPTVSTPTDTAGLDSREQTPGRPAPKSVTVTSKFAEEVRQAQRELKAIQAELKAERSLRQKRLVEERHGLIRSFCERLVKEGRLTPAQVEIGKDGQPLGPVAKALVAADAVHKFSDGKTGLQLQMESYEALPARQFGEQVPDPMKQQGEGLSAERREFLMSQTATGRRVLAGEQEKKQTAALFAEALGGVIKQHLNGNGRA